MPLQLDVTDKNSVQRAFEVLEERQERLDVCINNAGIDRPTRLFLKKVVRIISSHFLKPIPSEHGW